MSELAVERLSFLPPYDERRLSVAMSSPSGPARGTPFEGGSLVEMLRFRARVQPDEQAFVFLRDGEDERDTVSYAELDRRSRLVAAELQRRVSPGARALLLYPPGLDFVSAFFGCLYARVVAVPVFPPRWRLPDRNLARVIAVAEDADPGVVLSTSVTADRWARAVTDQTVPNLASAAGGRRAARDRLAWIATDALDDGAGPTWCDPGAHQRTLAFLQYTSGSTASPRGVMVSHGNLLHNLSYAFHQADNDASSASVSWLPFVHDMGLIDGVLQPIYSGCPAYLMSPIAFLQRPGRWLRAISTYRATRSGAPNFAYDLCVRRVTAEERAELDLSSWRDAYNGAEPIRQDTLERFAARFAENGFRSTALRPCYGLAEATLLVTSARYGEGSSCQSAASVAIDGGGRGVSCGRPGFGTSVVIVDPNSQHPCADGVVGEVWVQGPSVADGYWNRRAESIRTFAACTADGTGPFLRTGDLGSIGDDGVQITGRLKDVLIVRGTKHYPQDLERTAEAQHHAVRPGCVAAFGIGRNTSGDRIGLVAEIEPHRVGSSGDADEVIAAIRRGMTDAHGVQLSAVTLVEPGAVEKTTSGKVKRFGCRDALLAGTLEVLAAWREPSPSDLFDVVEIVRPPVEGTTSRAQGLGCR